MTAQEAKQFSTENMDSNIEKAILQSVCEGKFYAKVFGEITKEKENELTGRGYKISKSTFNISTTINIIKWE